MTEGYGIGKRRHISREQKAKIAYVARPKAVERFVPRKGDGEEPRSSVEGDDVDGIAIPEPPDPDETHPAGGRAAPGMAAEPASWQGELDLVPLPGEAGDPQPDAAAAETDAGKAPESKDKATDAAGAAPAQASRDGAPDAGSEPAISPRTSDAGGARGSDWG